jgi:hypothetical protein
MSRLRLVSLLSTLALLGLAACSDVTGPTKTGFCPITGGSGTCDGGGITAQH